MHVATYLMFQGHAEEALNLYRQAFPSLGINILNRYPEEAGEMAGKLLPTRITIGEHEIMMADSPSVHEFTFTPSTSLFISFENEDELIHVHDLLADDGDVLMPLDDYGFSEMFAWINDKFGVSWQLNLP